MSDSYGTVIALHPDNYTLVRKDAGLSESFQVNTKNFKLLV